MKIKVIGLNAHSKWAVAAMWKKRVVGFLAYQLAAFISLLCPVEADKAVLICLSDQFVVELEDNPPVQNSGEWESPCGCRRCLENETFPATTFRFIVCPTCGNKRCPHASDHTYACTGSNEPGQPGSVFK